MKNSKYALLIICYLFISIAKVHSQEVNNDSIIKLADTYLTELTKLKQLNGVFLLKKGDKLILHKAYNLQEDTTSTLYVTKKSQFDLRSVAKLIAKDGIHKLALEKKIDLIENVATYIPEFPKEKNITITHLLNHTSGLAREFVNTPIPALQMTNKDVLVYITEQPLEFSPGTEERYSNLGFQLIYYLLGEVSNTSYAQFIRTNYFTPLQMQHSGSNFNDNKAVKNSYAFGHYLNDDKTVSCVCEFPDDDIKMGHLFSTAQDLDYLLSSFKEGTHDHLIDNGIIMHAGGTRGKRAYVERDFNNDHQIIFLTNYDAIPFQKIVQDLQNILKGNSIVMPKIVNRKETNIEASILKQYEGTYDLVDAGHILLTFKLIEGQLHVFQKGKDKGALSPESSTIFFDDPRSEESIEFIKDSLGNWSILVDFQGIRFKGIKKN